ncbi:MAG: SDR family oxidoreductase, partial [Sphingobacteriales bacterium]
AAQVADKFGKLDILFINAGVLGGAGIEGATEADFDYVMDVNFKGAFFTLSRFIPILNDGASVVFLSSNVASMNAANASIYSSSKAALNAIMKIAAVELAPRKIRVNSVSPGPTQTEILNKYLTDKGFSSLHYHAGLSRDKRLYAQQAWMEGKTRIMAGTTFPGREAPGRPRDVFARHKTLKRKT